MPTQPTQYCCSFFYGLRDNVVKQKDYSFSELRDMLTNHSVITDEEKASLMCISGWKYKSLDDPLVDNGHDKDGRKIKKFSPVGVRRISSNLIEMSIFFIDIDGQFPIAEARNRFSAYKHIGYTSLNHQVANPKDNKPATDRYRLAIFLKDRMPLNRFRELKPAIKKWLSQNDELICDAVTLSVGQIFLLPVVRAENKNHASAWSNDADLLDWRIFETLPDAGINTDVVTNNSARSNLPEFALSPDDVLQTSQGEILVKNIDRKISRVKCPFHFDRSPGEFVGVTNNGTPYLQCRKCGRVYMSRKEKDAIVLNCIEN